MPGSHEVHPPPTLVESVVPLLHADFATPVAAAAQVVTLPAQLVISALLVAGACLALLRRGRTGAATVWAAAWLLGDAVEVACKHALERPRLYRHGVHVAAFDSSWPSGHAVRAAIVAAALAAAWPRLRVPAALWLAAAVVLLEAAGFHTPSDLLGGLLVAALLVAGARAIERSGALRRRAARGRPAGAGTGAAPGGR